MDGVRGAVGRVLGAGVARLARVGAVLGVMGLLSVAMSRLACATDSALTLPDPGFDLGGTITSSVGSYIFPVIGTAIGLALMIWLIRVAVRFVKGIVR
jgi:hypothetical protein